MAEFYGMDEETIISRMESGEMMTEIAEELGVNRSMLWRWLNADQQRSARAKDARRNAAVFWDEKSEKIIGKSMDPFELSKAKELAHHYRWRASKIGANLYGDKVDHNVTGSVDHNHVLTFVDPTGAEDEPQVPPGV